MRGRIISRNRMTNLILTPYHTIKSEDGERIETRATGRNALFYDPLGRAHRAVYMLQTRHHVNLARDLDHS